MAVFELLYYISAEGVSPFDKWFASLDREAKTKVATAIARLGQGNISNVKSAGEGVSEYRINWGAGYRVYFGRDGETLVILLTGGTKKKQQHDIKSAHQFWMDYKRRKTKTH